MTTRISSALLRRITGLAAADPGREICGLLLGTEERISEILPAANVHPQPACRFELDPAAHFAALRAARAGGPPVVGHYHSHPGGRAEPSSIDAAKALEPGQLWLIVAGDDARLWRVSRPGTFCAVPILPDDGGGCVSPGDPPQEPPR